MLDELRECDALVVYRADRLSRSLMGLLMLIEDVLNPQGTALVSVIELLDTTTPMGRAVSHMIGTFSELERGLIPERLREGRKSKAGGYATGEVTGKRPTANLNLIQTQLRSSSAFLSFEVRRRASSRLPTCSTPLACRRSEVETGTPQRRLRCVCQTASPTRMVSGTAQ